MADVKDGLEFFEGGVGMRFDVRLKFLRIKRAPFAPAGFWGERAVFGGGQIAVDRAPPLSPIRSKRRAASTLEPPA
jgi:hypothetical protein